MGYLLRVRASSFMAGAAVASLAGLYLFQKDFNVHHRSLSQQVDDFFRSNKLQIEQSDESLSKRISDLEKKLKEIEAPKPVEATQ